ncbi:thioesterase II family protein [Aquimarina aquimarini]|uniref:thioesterase II family protein n=1 Tax=Aquimarina aquimarini TaxID=1191734 RepID=UPI000D54FA9A|nr:thioesterase domain-containing protein [Aquimarina aquimarini]
MKIICIHYGGGNKFSFAKLEEHIDSTLVMESIELPGHGKRIKENLLTDLNEMAVDIYHQIKNITDDEPYILYGHSLGGMLCFLVSRLLQKKEDQLPLHMIISSCKAPRYNHVRKVTCHTLSDEDFKEELRVLGGFPKRAIENKEILDFFLPILRADFKAIETYEYKQDKALDIPITVLAGLDEDVSKEQLIGWQEETKYPFRFQQFEGGHFFILDKFQEIGSIINKAAHTAKSLMN